MTNEEQRDSLGSKTVVRPARARIERVRREEPESRVLLSRQASVRKLMLS